MQMSLQANSLTSCWFRQTTTMDPTRHAHHQNDSVSANDCEDQIYNGRHVTPYDKEPMFEKPLTPSDVGKLNRLVIPKQHAEKHFPLSGFGAGDGAETLLGFEDESGKPWRFRYSYWNSSQSYVLTKGWSRYVKEKRLDAGDVVFFERHRAEPERLFIGWRRRGAAPTVFSYNAQGYYQAQDSRGHGQAQGYQADCLRAPAAAARGGAEAARGGGGGSNSRRHVRLFGVNLECQHVNNPSTSQTTSSEAEGSNLLTTQQQQGNGYYFDYNAHQPPPSTHHSHPSYHMELNFTQGVNWMGNGLG